jgi:hypothetical protein
MLSLLADDLNSIVGAEHGKGILGNHGSAVDGILGRGGISGGLSVGTLDLGRVSSRQDAVTKLSP